MPSILERRAAKLEQLRNFVPSEVDPHASQVGVLLSDEIIFYASTCNLIHPFDPEHLKPAGYELTIGDEYFLSGEFCNLTEKVTIPPFQVAVLKTAEIICLPRYMIARWNIRVKHAYAGLLWVGGPQVDPGYTGHLFCPIYNLSDKEVTLWLGEPIALMDFVKTTSFDPSKDATELKRYNVPPKRVVLQEYEIDDLQSALFTKAGVKLAEFEEEITNLNTRLITFTQISFAIFAIVIALVAIISRVGVEAITLGAAVSSGAAIFLSVFALLVSILSYTNRRVGRFVYEQYGRVIGERADQTRRFLRRAWLFGMSACMIVSGIAGIGAYWLVEPFFVKVRQQTVLTKDDLDALGVDKIVQRMDAIEGAGLVRPGDLDKLKAELEQKIQNVKTGTGP